MDSKSENRLRTVCRPSKGNESAVLVSGLSSTARWVTRGRGRREEGRGWAGKGVGKKEIAVVRKAEGNFRWPASEMSKYTTDLRCLLLSPGLLYSQRNGEGG